MGRKQWWIAGTLFALAIVAGALVALRPRMSRPAQQIQKQTLPPEAVLPAKIRARAVVAVAAPSEGTIESFAVEAGQPVYEGQVLGRIRSAALDTDQQTAASEYERADANRRELETQMITARADAARARNEASRTQAGFDRALRAYTRQQLLVREGATPRLVFEKAEHEMQAAKVERDTASDLARGAEERLALAVKNLDAARHTAEEHMQTLDRAKEAAEAADVRSPVNGMLVSRAKQVGEEVTPEVQNLFEITTDPSALEAVMEPDAATLARLHPGMEALLSTGGADVIPAQISAIQGKQVLIDFTSPTPAVRPGMTAQVRIRFP